MNMNRQAFHRTFFVAGILLASSAIAGQDVNRCVDEAGHVTLTDAPCPGGARSATTRVVVAPAQLRHDTWVKKPVAGRSLAVDVATLKAAQLNLRDLDNASSAIRNQRLAGLN
jgi:hypothetical protein